jgi:hypothetical protein
MEYTLPCVGFELTMLVVIGTDCTGSTQRVFGSIPDLFKSRNKKLVSTPALRSKNKGWLD